MTARTKKSVKRLHHHVIHAVVPHAGNDYRPHLIRWQGIVLILVLVFGLQLMNGLPVAGSGVSGSTTDVTAERLLEATNGQRKAHDLKPLRTSERLNIAAAMKAQDMLIKQYWSHESPAGVTPWDWFEAAGYDYKYAGENLGKGFRTSSGVIKAWMDSSEHRDNLLSKQYADVGFAVAEGMLNSEDTNVIVALYGTEKNNPAASVAGVVAANGNGTGLISRFGIGLQSLPPVALGSIVLMLLVTGVALAAHAYRNRLPKTLRQSWHRHNGLYKAGGMACLAIVTVALYGGGQI